METLLLLLMVFCLSIRSIHSAGEHSTTLSISHCFREINTFSTFPSCYAMINNQSKAIKTKTNHSIVDEIVHPDDPNLLQYCLTKQLYNNLQIKSILLTDYEHYEEAVKYTKYLQFDITIHIIPTIDNAEILQQLIHVRSDRYQMFLIFCSFECTAEILYTARIKTDDMCDKQYIWLTIHKEVILTDIALPYNLLSLDRHLQLPCNNEEEGGEENCLDNLLSVCSNYGNGALLTLSQGEKRTWLEATTSDVNLILKSLISRLPDYLRVVTIRKVPYLMTKELEPDQFDALCVQGLPCTEYVTVNGTKTSKKLCCFGLEIDYLKQLEIDMGFISEIYLVEDGYFGSFTNGRWNGLVADLKDNKADLALATLSINQERSAVIDFCETFADEHAALLTAAEEHVEPFFNAKILSPFSPIWWASFLGSLVLISFFMSGIERLGSPDENHYYPFIDSLCYLFALFVERSVGAKDPSILSTRVVAVCVAIATLTIIASFTAALTVDMVDTHVDFAVEGLRDPKVKCDVLHDKDLQDVDVKNQLTEPGKEIAFGLLGFSSWTTFFRDIEDEQLHKLYTSSNKVEYKILADGMKLMRTGQLSAIVNDEKVLHDYACREKQVIFHVSEEVVKLIGMSIAIQKNSKLKERISHYTRIYKEIGLLKKYESKWLQTNCHEDEEIAYAVTIFGFGGGFVLLIFGAAFATLVLFMEHIYTKVTQGKPCSGFCYR